MTDAEQPGPPPGPEDLARAVLARAAARLAVARAGETYDAMFREAFRREVGVTVRRVSPVLVALLEHEALPLDEIVWSIVPGPAWPHGPLSVAERSTARRRNLVTGAPSLVEGLRSTGGIVLGVAEGGRVRVEVVDGAIEVDGRIGTVRVRTRGNLASLTVPGAMPREVAAAAMGRPASELVSIAVLRNRDWPINRIDVVRRRGASTITIETGSRPYVVPWARPPLIDVFEPRWKRAGRGVGDGRAA